MKIAISPPRPHKNKYIILVGLVVFLIILSLVTIAMLRLSKEGKPVITAISPVIGDPGSLLIIQGSNFGKTRGDSYVEFDGVAPTMSSYVKWTETRIELTVPLYAESCLIHIVTDSGRSNPKIFMSKALLPNSPAASEAKALGPSIESLSSESGCVGSTLVIRGLNFGANRGDSVVLFKWLGEPSGRVGSDQPAAMYVSPNDYFGEYELWSDKEIRVRVPDGAATGGVAVKTAKFVSPIKYFQVIDMPGTKVYRNKVTYSLTSFVSVSRIKTDGNNSLYLWLPFPATSSSQRDVKPLSRSSEPLLADYKGISAYRFTNITSNASYTVSHDFFVQVYSVSNEIRTDKIRQAPSPLPALYEKLTAKDILVPSDNSSIVKLTKSVLDGDRNAYRAAFALLKALVSKVKYSDAETSADLDEALKLGQADAWNMALLYTAMLRAAGIPAIPVAGVVVDTSQRAWKHFWAEFYIYGFGWIAVDPVLFAGGKVGNFTPPFTDSSNYFGNIDNQHIAFSRGISMLEKITPEGRTVGASRRYSFQNIYEEASGDIKSYTSFWSDIEISGIY